MFTLVYTCLALAPAGLTLIAVVITMLVVEYTAAPVPSPEGERVYMWHMVCMWGVGVVIITCISLMRSSNRRTETCISYANASTCMRYHAHRRISKMQASAGAKAWGVPIRLWWIPSPLPGQGRRVG